ncbi:2-hydroxyacid dehydrogenase [Piscinibacter terrae]|uniref:2-hydroxyacid dehydrogenase n=1 Tax=Piscinibacter terrae TaxID=2496871 RepID=A0A3N7K7G7_9BURK|nr:2-hydroxyacid dehydrogenase [Albitalea terrae]RQP26795.1 2-hydroxyacid dehydrogenase [Albitalea terrae]
MKRTLLLLITMGERSLSTLHERFEVIHAPTASERAAAVASHGTRVEIVLTNGVTGLRADEIDAMPKLTLACALGAGYENLAVDYARARGIALANGAGTNDDCVADHALALMLATVRAIPALDKACRQGLWRDDLPMRPQLARKRLGVLGLGTIGKKIAQRGAAFDMPVGYHNRSARHDVPHRYFDSVQALAEWCDVLVIATPGGASTKHLIDASVLQALGPQGFLVNIARGSVVDTSALAAALRAGELGGAGLDVYETEPKPPAELLDLANVVLTPHIAGWSPESMQASLECFLENADLHFAGRPLRTPI